MKIRVLGTTMIKLGRGGRERRGGMKIRVLGTTMIKLGRGGRERGGEG